MQTVTAIGTKKAVDVAKPFVGSLKKLGARLIIKSAYVDDRYVIATDSRVLIRIKHGENVSEPYLHHYVKGTQDLIASLYPSVDRIIPDTCNAKEQFAIHVPTFLNAHELASIAAKEHGKNTVFLEGNEIRVAPVEEILVKGKKVLTAAWKRIAFKHCLDTDTKVSVRYNCDYMLMAMKAFKKLRITNVTCYFFGPTRPVVFVDAAQQIEILIMPIKPL